MNISTIDQQYLQLQAEAQSVSQTLQTLADKLSVSSSSEAREFTRDLKELALAIQKEQTQVLAVMQAIYQAVQNEQPPQSPQWRPSYPQTPQPSMPRGPAIAALNRGFLPDFLNSGFGRAIERGVGFGIGDDLIHKLFH